MVTSEASYCRSLDIVVEHFVKSKQLGALLTTQDRNWLFSRLADVRAISRRSEAHTNESWGYTYRLIFFTLNTEVLTHS